jgi:hypothetical protein
MAPAYATSHRCVKALTLTAAQARVPYHILKPAIRSLGAPDEVYVQRLWAADQVALVYHTRRSLPWANTTGVGLLLTAFPGSTHIAGWNRRCGSGDAQRRRFRAVMARALCRQRVIRPASRMRRRRTVAGPPA